MDNNNNKNEKDRYDGPILDWSDVPRNVNPSLPADDTSTICYSLPGTSSQMGPTPANSPSKKPLENIEQYTGSDSGSSHGTIQEFRRNWSCHYCPKMSTTVEAQAMWDFYIRDQESRFVYKGQQ